jgi:hypothetical protein
VYDAMWSGLRGYRDAHNDRAASAGMAERPRQAALQELVVAASDRQEREG